MEKRPKLVILQAKKAVNLQLFFTVYMYTLWKYLKYLNCSTQLGGFYSFSTVLNVFRKVTWSFYTNISFDRYLLYGDWFEIGNVSCRSKRYDLNVITVTWRVDLQVMWPISNQLPSCFTELMI